MFVEKPPERLVDESDGKPIQKLEPKGSVYSQVEVKGADDRLIILAQDRASGEVEEIEARMVNKTLRGVRVLGTPRRRDVSNDMQDCLETLGYTVLDQEVRHY